MVIMCSLLWFVFTSPRRLIFGGAYYRRYFCVSDLGGFYTEGLIFGILRYIRKSKSEFRK